ncbi:MAG TPA: hypothetical protein VMH85_21050 [Terriglobales bacterium]|nr:hypothetical protein [Terriglobales bacterium]
MTTKPVVVRLLVVIFLVLLAGFRPLSSQAQAVPRLSVSVSPSWIRYDSKTVGFAGSTDLFGGTGAATFNLNTWFGGTAQIFGDYGDHVHLKGWMAGPQFYHQKFGGVLFGHVLFGRAQTRLETVVGNRELDVARCYALGGGFELPLGQRFSVRPIEADYLSSSATGTSQHNVRISVGLVYRWGALKATPKLP